MFFFFSKVLDVALTPLAWSVALIAFGLVGVGRRGLVVAGVVVLLFFSLEPVSNALYRSLESPPVRSVRPELTYDVVVLLGGIGEERVLETWGERAFNDNSERLLETFDRLRTGKARYAILSGGTTSPGPNEKVEARMLADQLLAWGIAPERIVLDDHARNTHENAVNTAAIVRARGWQSVLVVTSAFHMRRALECFRAENLAVDTMPVDFRSYGTAYSGELIPRADHLAESTAALREWVGRWVYELRGYARRDER